MARKEKSQVIVHFIARLQLFFLLYLFEVAKFFMADQDTSQAPVLRTNQAEGQAKKMTDVNRKFKEQDIRSQAQSRGIPYVDLSRTPVSQEALHLTTLEAVQNLQTIPFLLAGPQVKIATVKPESPEVKAYIEQYKKQKYKVELYLCSDASIEYTYHLFKAFKPQEKIEVIEEVKEEKDVSSEQIAESIFLSPEEVEAKKGIELLNLINLAAIKTRASDIHIQPDQEKVTVRFRLDGMLKEVFQLTSEKLKEVSNEIKRQAKLKLNIGTPQDGQYTFKVNDRRVNVRVSIFPIKRGESIVLRILDSQKQKASLKEMGLSSSSYNNILEALKQTSGLILTTGPTGSGKTSTLYAVLKEINDPKKKIITLENPVEYEIEHVSQSEINEDEDYTFEAGLRSILRQDPDIIMIGEIRDKTTAETAVQAALTGHQVLSTMHANSAIDTIPRLINIGVKSYILSSAISLVIAQRLIRKVCKCAEQKELTPEAQEEIQKVIEGLTKDGFKIDWEVPTTKKQAKGCEACARTGYSGRMILAETLPITEDLRDAIVKKEKRNELYKIARKHGFITLKEEAMRSVMMGDTTLEEVWRVIG
jgi:type II secretory ATPase GspE/PulE/Tfp pilus assembly ATPase PilB-like protein